MEVLISPTEFGKIFKDLVDDKIMRKLWESELVRRKQVEDLEDKE